MSPMSTIAVLQLGHLTTSLVWELDSDNFLIARSVVLGIKLLADDS